MNQNQTTRPSPSIRNCLAPKLAPRSLLGADTSMATAQQPAAPPVHPTVRRGVLPLRAAQGNSFLFRKLHSLLGVIPIGAFLLEHLLSNFEALKGPAAYGAQVKF